MLQNRINQYYSWSSCLQGSVAVGEMPEAASDDREEAQEHDKCTVGLYKKDILVGHIQIEISSLCFHFINQDPENKIKALTTGKRQREIGLDFLS